MESIEHLERPPQSLWERVLAEPDRAPEYIALAAAERFGPQAEEWVRIVGPGHTPEELARVAYRKHVWLARLEGGALGAGGVFTAAPDMVAPVADSTANRPATADMRRTLRPSADCSG